MKLAMTCLPGYEDVVPRPRLAAAGLPDWLKSMPATAHSASLEGEEVRTLKQCPPFVDAMRSGIVFPLAADLKIENGVFSWDWDLPAQPAARDTRAPIGLHVPEQAHGVPGLPAGQFVIKFNNFWTIQLPPGYAMLFGHPANRVDLPFRTLNGQVDVDTFVDGFVHFPAIWTEPGFSGVLPAGTPVAQGWPVQRVGLELELGPMSERQLNRHRALQDGLEADPGLYRKHYRGKS